MKYKALFVVALFLLSAIISIPASCEEETEQSEAFDWEVIAESNTPIDPKSTQQDLKVKVIERKHLSIYNEWEARWKLEVYKNAILSFHDRLSIVDGSVLDVIQYYHHDEEAFYAGQTPYYTSDTFAISGTFGWRYVRVDTDYYDNVDEESNLNNCLQVRKYFIWVPGY